MTPSSLVHRFPRSCAARVGAELPRDRIGKRLEVARPNYDEIRKASTIASGARGRGARQVDARTREILDGRATTVRDLLTSPTMPAEIVCRTSERLAGVWRQANGALHAVGKRWYHTNASGRWARLEVAPQRKLVWGIEDEIWLATDGPAGESALVRIAADRQEAIDCGLKAPSSTSPARVHATSTSPPSETASPNGVELLAFDKRWKSMPRIGYEAGAR